MPAHPTLLIVYHSVTGGTAQMAEAARLGASRVDGASVRLLRAAEAGAADLLAAQGFLFAMPENLGSMSGGMKDFFDRSYYDALDRLSGRPYVALVCAGSDGRGAARQLERIAAGWRLRAVAEARIVCVQAQSAEAIRAPKRIDARSRQACEELGESLAQGLALGVF